MQMTRRTRPGEASSSWRRTLVHKAHRQSTTAFRLRFGCSLRFGFFFQHLNLFHLEFDWLAPQVSLKGLDALDERVDQMAGLFQFLCRLCATARQRGRCRRCHAMHTAFARQIVAGHWVRPAFRVTFVLSCRCVRCELGCLFRHCDFNFWTYS